MFFRLTKTILLLACFGLLMTAQIPLSGQTPEAKKADTAALYVDLQNGMTADEAVARALENNSELKALTKDAESAKALISQAKLRANPSLETSGAKQIGGSDNSLMIQGSLPLELGGRRNARVRIAEQEAEIRALALAERERLLAAEVRGKFGESLAAVYKLKFAEEILNAETENYKLISALVTEGRRAPLEQNMETVELNRIRAMRETTEGAVEIKLLELRNLLGMSPDEPLRLRGNFENLLELLPPQFEAVQRALRTRPDLLGAKALEELSAARIEQARAEGRIDADVMLGYQRMKSGFPFSGYDSAGILQPIESKFHFFTFGVKFMLPIRNRNQGMIEAAILEEEAARNRREFGQLTIRREIASAYISYDRATRAMEIYRVGVREQAEANLNVVRQTFELGSKTLLDYIAENRRYIEIESGFIDAQLEVYLARVGILRATNATELKRK